MSTAVFVTCRMTTAWVCSLVLSLVTVTERETVHNDVVALCIVLATVKPHLSTFVYMRGKGRNKLATCIHNITAQLFQMIGMHHCKQK